MASTKVIRALLTCSAVLFSSALAQPQTANKGLWEEVRRRLEPVKVLTASQLDSVHDSHSQGNHLRTIDTESTSVIRGGDSSLTTEGTTGVATLRRALREGGETAWEPMVALSPVNPSRFLAVYISQVSGTRRAQASVTNDGGGTWSISDVPLSWYLYELRNDPVVAFDADGRAFYCYLDHNAPPGPNAIVVARSNDGGTAWHDRLVVREVADPSSLEFNDKPWIAIDQSTSAHRNNVYVVWTRIVEQDGVIHYRIVASRKRPIDSGFQSFTTVSTQVSGGEYVQGSNVVVAPDGTVFVFWLRMNESTNTGGFFFTKSTNGGATFEQETQLSTLGSVVDVQGHALGGLFQRAESFPSVAVRPVGGSYELALTWADYRNSKPEVLFSKSANGGSFWSSVVQVAYGALEQFCPALTSNSAGTLRIAYFERLNSSTNDIQLKVAESLDGGATFWSSTDGSVFNGAVLFTADYIGIASNDYTFWVVWPGLVGDGGAIPYNNDIFGSYRAVAATIMNDIPCQSSIW